VTRKKKTIDRSTEPTYEAVLADVVGLVDAARHAAVRSTNAVMTATYWAIGRRIVEHEQHGAERASYGEELIVRLSGDLQSRFGRGFGRANLFQMPRFTLLIATFSRQRPENLPHPSGKSRHCLDFPQIVTLYSLPPLVFRCHGHTTPGSWPCLYPSSKRFIA
jgi:DUF1016 N-terminal domain